MADFWTEAQPWAAGFVLPLLIATAPAVRWWVGRRQTRADAEDDFELKARKQLAEEQAAIQNRLSGDVKELRVQVLELERERQRAWRAFNRLYNWTQAARHGFLNTSQKAISLWAQTGVAPADGELVPPKIPSEEYFVKEPSEHEWDK